jgi:hypothetical protein
VGSEIAVTFACVALGLATLVFIFFFQEDPADSSPLRTRLDQLLERRDVIYDNLRDLRFEYRTGKFSEHDFEQVKSALEAEAAQVLLEIERATGAGTHPPRGAPAQKAGNA